MDGPEFPKIEKTPIDEKAVNYMYKMISMQKEKVHLVGTAQLTNIALLLTIYPEIKSNIASIVIMGGAIGMGNTSPCAEFNIEVITPYIINIKFCSVMQKQQKLFLKVI